MSIQARFFIQQASAMSNGSAEPGKRQGSVSLGACCRGPENKSWSAATPAGKFEMTITNPDAFEWFLSHLGAEVAITIEERPALCEVCHEEVVAGWDQPTEMQGTGGYSGIPFHHQGCEVPTA